MPSGKTAKSVDFSSKFADLLRYVHELAEGKKVAAGSVPQSSQASLGMVHLGIQYLLDISKTAEAEKTPFASVDDFSESCEKLCAALKQIFPDPEGGFHDVLESLARLKDIYRRLTPKNRSRAEEADATRCLYTIVKEGLDRCRRCQTKTKNSPCCAFKTPEDASGEQTLCWQCWRDKKGLAQCRGLSSAETDLTRSRKRKVPPSPGDDAPTRDAQAARHSSLSGITIISSSPTGNHPGQTTKPVEKQWRGVSPSSSGGEEIDVAAPSMSHSQSPASVHSFMEEPRLNCALQLDSLFTDLAIQISDQSTTIRGAKEAVREVHIEAGKERNIHIAECQAKVEAATVEYCRAEEDHAQRIREADRLLGEAKIRYEEAKDEAEKEKQRHIDRVDSLHRINADRIAAERDAATAGAVVKGRHGQLDYLAHSVKLFVENHGTAPFNDLGGAHGSRASAFVAMYAKLREEKLLANDPSLTGFLRKIRDVLPDYVKGLELQDEQAAGDSGQTEE